MVRCWRSRVSRSSSRSAPWTFTCCDACCACSLRQARTCAARERVKIVIRWLTHRVINRTDFKTRGFVGCYFCSCGLGFIAGPLRQTPEAGGRILIAATPGRRLAMGRFLVTPGARGGWVSMQGIPRRLPSAAGLRPSWLRSGFHATHPTQLSYHFRYNDGRQCNGLRRYCKGDALPKVHPSDFAGPRRSGHNLYLTKPDWHHCSLRKCFEKVIYRFTWHRGSIETSRFWSGESTEAKPISNSRRCCPRSGTRS
jgi:hypothetical protein